MTDIDPYTDFWFSYEFNHHKFPVYVGKESDPCMGSFVGRKYAINAKWRGEKLPPTTKQDGHDPS